MTVTDTLARIDYALMIETNAAGAEWLLDEFDRKLGYVFLGPKDAGVYIRPMIDLLDDYHGCFCDYPTVQEWLPPFDAYHSFGDVGCRVCKRIVHELDATCETHVLVSWVCHDCQPLPSLLDEEAS